MFGWARWRRSIAPGTGTGNPERGPVHRESGGFGVGLEGGAPRREAAGGWRPGARSRGAAGSSEAQAGGVGGRVAGVAAPVLEHARAIAAVVLTIHDVLVQAEHEGVGRIVAILVSEHDLVAALDEAPDVRPAVGGDELVVAIGLGDLRGLGRERARVPRAVVERRARRAVLAVLVAVLERVRHRDLVHEIEEVALAVERPAAHPGLQLEVALVPRAVGRRSEGRDRAVA